MEGVRFAARDLSYLVNHDLGLKNAERGTVERLDGTVATIRWDREDRVQDIDLSQHKSWDHGYAETVYSAQSKTYDRAYVLAPVNSGLVTGQNYYTAITRARYGVKLWTEDRDRLVDKLERHSGEKTSALEGLGRLERDSHKARDERHGERWDRLRDQQRSDREQRNARIREERGHSRCSGSDASLGHSPSGHPSGRGGVAPIGRPRGCRSFRRGRHIRDGRGHGETCGMTRLPLTSIGRVLSVREPVKGLDERMLFRSMKGATEPSKFWG